MGPSPEGDDERDDLIPPAAQFFQSLCCPDRSVACHVYAQVSRWILYQGLLHIGCLVQFSLLLGHSAAPLKFSRGFPAKLALLRTTIRCSVARPLLPTLRA